MRWRHAHEELDYGATVVVNCNGERWRTAASSGERRKGRRLNSVKDGTARLLDMPAAACDRHVKQLCASARLSGARAVTLGGEQASTLLNVFIVYRLKSPPSPSFSSRFPTATP